jgi:hypothetical protein
MYYLPCIHALHVPEGSLSHLNAFSHAVQLLQGDTGENIGSRP